MKKTTNFFKNYHNAEKVIAFPKKKESLNTIHHISSLSDYWFFWLKQVFCLCALECEAAVAALSRYEGLHYEQHPLPFQGKFTSWAIAAVEKAPHPGLWAGLLFLRGTIHLTRRAGPK